VRAKKFFFRTWKVFTLLNKQRRESLLHDISTEFAHEEFVVEKPIYHEAELVGRELTAPRSRVST